MKNSVEAMTMREFANGLFAKAEWHHNNANAPVSMAMADSIMEVVFHRLKAEIFADIARSAEETAERISQ